MTSLAVKTEAYWKGYEAKMEEVTEIGFVKARDAFNIAHPPGQKWTGSQAGFQYSIGEADALYDAYKRLPKPFKTGV